MGKATRWLKGLLGMNKVDKENIDKRSNLADKKRWSFVKSGKESRRLSQIPTDGSDWMRSYISDAGKEQSKHAIAVAAATAAAADAAVAAANAAVAVVRLTSQGRGRGLFFAEGRERLAAAKIQAVFRGYLARKALRALKGLVKLQALVRAYLVRKRAAATLHSMQALFRAQTAVRSQRARRSMSNEQRSQPVMSTRKSIERFEETRSEFHSKRFSSSYDPSLGTFDESPKIVEVDTGGPKSRSRRLSTCMSDNCENHQYYQVVSSPIPCPVSTRHSVPNSLHGQDFDWRFAEEDYKFATAQNTPRFGRPGRDPATPAKSVCGDSIFRTYSHCPSYMANTQSFRAKVRSHSAPRQRPSSGTKKRLSLDELMASRASFSGVRMRRACPQVEEEDFES